MDLLLDTHILVWAHTNDSRLSEKAKNLITDTQNKIYFSPVSIWEVEIKHNAHPDYFPFSGERLDYLSRAADMIFLPLLSRQIALLGRLHYADNAPRVHKDPFDRILICQAKAENMLFLTHDSLIPFYDEPCVISV